ncbi:MAG: ribosome biogenesis GTP-binding protein YihA/YsxC [Bacteroidales bacterium]
MIIKDAKFIISNSRADMCPKHDRPEYAFIGRSNVGKSTHKNILTAITPLAKTSYTPGNTILKTNSLNTHDWYLVDLPGYGYAQRGKSEMSKLKSLIEHYVLEREELTCLFVLIDSRHELQAKDAEFIHLLGENGVPFGIIFTKADKLSKTAAKNNVENICKALSEEWEELPPYFVTSSATGLGKDEVLDFIESCNNSIDA